MTTETSVINIRHGGRYDVYIGRPSIWGNPFIIGRDGTREEVVEKYENYARSDPKIMASLDKLEGRVLGCFCKPEACHGDVLVKLLEERDRDL